jgi:hypothetical protein
MDFANRRGISLYIAAAPCMIQGLTFADLVTRLSACDQMNECLVVRAKKDKEMIFRSSPNGNNIE